MNFCSHHKAKFPRSKETRTPQLNQKLVSVQTVQVNETIIMKNLYTLTFIEHFIMLPCLGLYVPMALNLKYAMSTFYMSSLKINFTFIMLLRGDVKDPFECA